MRRHSFEEKNKNPRVICVTIKYAERYFSHASANGGKRNLYVEMESINRKRIRKKAPRVLSLGRRQSPCQQAQVMINVLECSSRSQLRTIWHPTLSSSRNVLGILAQPSPPSINHQFKIYKTLSLSLSNSLLLITYLLFFLSQFLENFFLSF